MTQNERDLPPAKRIFLDELRIVQAGNGLFQVIIHGDPLLTYAGDPVCHRSRRLIQQVVDELDGQGRLFAEGNKIVQPHFNLSYTILCVQKRMIETGIHPERGFARWIAGDPMFYRCAGPEVSEQLSRWGPVLDYLSDLGHRLPVLVAHDPGDDEPEETCDAAVFQTPWTDLCERLTKEFEQLLPEEKAVVLHLSCIHHGLVLFPMALVLGRCTANDYARGAMAAHSMLVDMFVDATDDDYQQSFDELRNHANLALSYLRAAGITELGGRYFKGQSVRVEESRNYEFKEVTGHNPVRTIRDAVDRYVVGFLNNDEGGHILWGVTDRDGCIVGVTLTYNQRDELRRLIADRLSGIQPRIDHSQYRIQFHPVVDADGPVKDCFVVDVHVPQRVAEDPYYTSGNECYVRADGVLNKLSGPSLTDWIRLRVSRQRSEGPAR